MAEHGSITRAEEAAARRGPLTLTDGLRRDEPFGLYFKEQVRRELVERFGWERVSEGGLRVYTTIDAGLQRSVEEIVERNLARIERRPGYRHAKRGPAGGRTDGEKPDYLQAAVVVLDPASGEVRALIGGRDFDESRFNRAMQAQRQPGSAFKPFVYAAAIEQGFTAATVLTNLDDPMLTPQGMWMPEDEHSDGGDMTLRTALRTSSNRAAVALLRQVGTAEDGRLRPQLRAR